MTSRKGKIQLERRAPPWSLCETALAFYERPSLPIPPHPCVNWYLMSRTFSYFEQKAALMLINEIPDKECREILARATVGRLACSHQDQPYVIPTYLAYDDGWIYLFATFGKKIEWMRENPKVCVEIEEVAANSQWVSVIAN